MFDQSAIQALTKAEAITAALKALDNGIAEPNVRTGAVALPSDFSVHDLEHHLPLRRRARGTMNTSALDSFGSYVDAHKEPGAVAFVEQDNMRATAVLNLGTPERPGHADSLAVLTAKSTSAYKALIAIVGQARSQTAIAEFFEDWAPNLRFFKDNDTVAHNLAIAAVRKLTIESLRKLENTEQQLSNTKSTFESVSASSSDPIPTTIYFGCEPYYGLTSRVFVLRLGIITSGDKPTLVLRIVKMEEHAEEMAQELANLVSDKLDGQVPVVIGTYSRGK